MFLKRSLMIAFSVLIALFIVACGNATTSGGGTVRGDCVRTLEVDQQNIITKWEWKGNNCPFADILEYSNWERKSR